jgi:hypothetical protein
MKKYGFHNFKFEEIYCSKDFQHLCQMERYFIKLYNSTDRQEGYNLSEGGEANVPSKEGIERIRQFNINRWKDQQYREKVIPKFKKAAIERIDRNWEHLHSEENRKKSAQNRKGKYVGSENHNYGKPGTMSGVKFSEEHKNKIKNALMGNCNGKTGKSHHNAKKIQCVETGEIFHCIADAKLLYKGNIYKAAKNGTKADNKHWIHV